MKITKRHLRRIIREQIESEYYKDLKKRGAHSGKITGDAKDFAKVLLSQIDTFISGLKSDLHKDDIKFKVYSSINSEFRKRYNEIEKGYNKNVRDPYLERERGKAAERQNKRNSQPKYTATDEEVDDYFF